MKVEEPTTELKDLAKLYAKNETTERLISDLGSELMGIELPEAAVRALYALNYKVGVLRSEMYCTGPGPEHLFGENPLCPDCNY